MQIKYKWNIKYKAWNAQYELIYQAKTETNQKLGWHSVSDVTNKKYTYLNKADVLHVRLTELPAAHQNLPCYLLTY